MAVIRGELEAGNFFVMRRAAIEDDRLTLKAKGLLAYLLSKPPNWRVSTSQLSSMGPDGKDAIGAAMKELVVCGFAAMVEVERMGAFVGYDYIITDVPMVAPGGKAADTGKAAPCGKAADTGKAATSNNDLSLEVVTKELALESRGVQGGSTAEKPQGSKKKQTRQAKNAAYPRSVPAMREHPKYPEFRQVWTELPHRGGNDPELDGFKAYLAHASREASSLEELIEAAKRYAEYCDAMKLTGSDKVMRGSTFLGPSQPWNQEWAIPLHSNGRR